VTHGAAIILAEQASGTDSSWDMILFVLGAAVNAVLLGINVIWTLASKREDRADENEAMAQDAKFDAIKASLDGLRVVIEGVAKRMDKYDVQFDNLRERDREIELEMTRQVERLNANVETALREMREAREEVRRG
jgi:hypothetical protein